ncbi:MAG: NAD(P)/FAD-dependent oxidoreductase [Pseudomonadota bacterium]
MDIAIAGAGIGGLSLATLLARAGHRIEIFDQFLKAAPVGSGLMLQETGLAVLGEMGLRQQAEARSSRIDRLYGRAEPSGRIVLDVRFSALRKTLFAAAIQRSAIFDLLYRAAQAAGVSFTGGVEIASADGRLGTFETSDGRQLGPFDLIIDCLGANSPLSSTPKSDLPFGALWATVEWPAGGEFSNTDLEQRYYAARQMSGLMPSGTPKEGAPLTATYFWSIEGSGEAAWRSQNISKWRDDARRLWPESAGIVERLDHGDLTFARYRHRTHSRPVLGRLVHIGDAWHATSPQLGQGANMALLDAFALAKAVEASSEIGDIHRAFLSMRRWHVRLYQTMSWLFTPVYQSNSRALPPLRDYIAAPLSRVPPAPAFLAAMVSGALGRPLKSLDLV